MGNAIDPVLTRGDMPVPENGPTAPLEFVGQRRYPVFILVRVADEQIRCHGKLRGARRRSDNGHSAAWRYPVLPEEHTQIRT